MREGAMSERTLKEMLEEADSLGNGFNDIALDLAKEIVRRAVMLARLYAACPGDAILADAGLGDK